MHGKSPSPVATPWGVLEQGLPTSTSVTASPIPPWLTIPCFNNTVLLWISIIRKSINHSSVENRHSLKWGRSQNWFSSTVILRKWGHSPPRNLKEPSEAQDLCGFWWPQSGQPCGETTSIPAHTYILPCTRTVVHTPWNNSRITSTVNRTFSTICSAASYMALTHQKTGTSLRLVIFPTSLSLRHLKAELYHWSIYILIHSILICNLSLKRQFYYFKSKLGGGERATPSKYVGKQILMKKKSFNFVNFQHFYCINIPTVAHLKLPKCHQPTWKIP